MLKAAWGTGLVHALQQAWGEWVGVGGSFGGAWCNTVAATRLGRASIELLARPSLLAPASGASCLSLAVSCKLSVFDVF